MANYIVCRVNLYFLAIHDMHNCLLARSKCEIYIHACTIATVYVAYNIILCHVAVWLNDGYIVVLGITQTITVTADISNVLGNRETP